MIKHLERIAIVLACLTAPLLAILAWPRATPPGITTRCHGVEILSAASSLSARPAPPGAPLATASSIGGGRIQSWGSCNGNHWRDPSWEDFTLGPLRLRHEDLGGIYGLGEKRVWLWAAPACPGGAVRLPDGGLPYLPPADLELHALPDDDYALSWKDHDGWHGSQVHVTRSTMVLWPRLREQRSFLEGAAFAWGVAVALIVFARRRRHWLALREASVDAEGVLLDVKTGERFAATRQSRRRPDGARVLFRTGAPPDNAYRGASPDAEVVVDGTHASARRGLTRMLVVALAVLIVVNGALWSRRAVDDGVPERTPVLEP